MKVHHFGFIVKDLEKNIKIYQNLGYICVSAPITDSIQNNTIVFMQNGSVLLELICPLDVTSSIYNFKEGFHHICYEVEDNHDFSHYFKTLKIGHIFTARLSAPALDNRMIVFACLINGEFVEFLFSPAATFI